MRRSRLQPHERSNFDAARPGSGCSAALQGDRERRGRAGPCSIRATLLYRRVRRRAQVGVEGGRSVGGDVRLARVSLVLARAWSRVILFFYVVRGWESWRKGLALAVKRRSPNPGRSPERMFFLGRRYR